MSKAAETPLPWIGRKIGRGAVSDFVRDTRRLFERVRFEVKEILANNHRVIAVGDLASSVNATAYRVGVIRHEQDPSHQQ